MDMNQILPLLPAVVMLLLVVLTRKVLISLGTGIILGALIHNHFKIGQSLTSIWTYFHQIFYADGKFDTGNILLLGFLLLLGIMTAQLASSGGSQAFGEWMIKKIKSRVLAQVMTIVLGLIIFIDDYFNSLAVGQVARPLTDKHRISRAKLAYYIDSTSAPVTVISPISSWGAFIIAILGGIFATNGITDLQPLTAFIQMIPYNFYAIAALLIVFLVAIFNFDIGPMKKHEDRAIEHNQLIDPDPKKAKVPGDLTNTFSPHEEGRVYHLIVPIVILFVATIVMMVFTGIQASGSNYTLLDILDNTNVNVSLFTGGLLAVITGLIFHKRQSEPRENTRKIILEGIKTMLPAIYILLLAWMIGSAMSDLNTGEHLADIVRKSTMPASMLPLVFFLIAGVMSLATGTSWGTFTIMLQIGADVTMNIDSTLLLPVLAAVLAGSVFGDHCTPISDTTILSSTGAGANHIDHVLTQLPYAFIAAFSASIGYILVGKYENLLLGLSVTIMIPIVLCVLNYLLRKKPNYK